MCLRSLKGLGLGILLISTMCYSGNGCGDSLGIRRYYRGDLFFGNMGMEMEIGKLKRSKVLIGCVFGKKLCQDLKF